MPDESFTPIHIRGKRKAISNSAPSPKKRFTRSHQLSSRSSRSAPPTLRKRQRICSRLEDLPTEVLEIIFLHSGNADLPLVSRALAAQLSGRGLQIRFMEAVLGPLFKHERRQLTDTDASLLESIFARRFCTWSLLQSWLAAALTPDIQTVELPIAAAIGFQTPPWSRSDVLQDTTTSAWPWPSKLCRSDRVSSISNPYPFPGSSVSGNLPRPLQVPEKLLHGPWSDDRLSFLECFCYINGIHLWSDDAECLRMSSFDGLRDAIKEHSLRALEALLTLGVDPDADLLQYAIVDQGCDLQIVQKLFEWRYHLRTISNQRHFSAKRYPRWPSFDRLDPVIWSWLRKPSQESKQAAKYIHTLLGVNLREDHM